MVAGMAAGGRALADRKDRELDVDLAGALEYQRAGHALAFLQRLREPHQHHVERPGLEFDRLPRPDLDRKSTRLNSSHVKISYAVFCLKKKKTTHCSIFLSNTQKNRDFRR